MYSKALRGCRRARFPRQCLLGSATNWTFSLIQSNDAGEQSQTVVDVDPIKEVEVTGNISITGRESYWALPRKQKELERKEADAEQDTKPMFLGSETAK